MRSIFSAMAALVAMLLFPLSRTISPLQRARAVQVQAYRAAAGGAPITRADVLADLAEHDRNHRPAVLVDQAPTQPDPEPALSDHPPITPATAGQAPDEVVSLTDAATRLGVSISTVRRYAAPSSGRLIRLGAGVTRASLEACAATR